jgi:S-adenosyl-L-methionine hydrolase (adenosine-forming)
VPYLIGICLSAQDALLGSVAVKARLHKNVSYLNRIFSWSVLMAFLLCGCGKRESAKEYSLLVALITDYGNKDAYVSQMKGSILSINPSVRLVDLDHDLPSQDLVDASYQLAKASASFPPGTVFIVVVEPGVGAGHKPILLQTKEGKYYIGPDNGVFTDVLEQQLVDQAVHLDNPQFYRTKEVSRTFHGRDIFGPVAAHLVAGVPPSDFGTKLKTVTRLKVNSPTMLGNKSTGQVAHVDRYGNVVTNLRSEHLTNQALGKLLKVTAKGRSFTMPFLPNYAEAPASRTFCFINSEGEFEIAIKEGSASAIHGLKAGDSLSIQK